MEEDSSIKPFELLLVGSSSSDLYSTVVVDPRTGVSTWSHKGSELLGSAMNKVIPLGKDAEHLVISALHRPFMHIVGVNQSERFHMRSTVSGPVKDFTSNSNGSLLFAAIGKRIFIWLVHSGEMVGVKEAHLQDISRISLSDDDAFVVTASEEGDVKVHLVADVMNDESGTWKGALREWRPHSLAVRGLSLSPGHSLRVASCSLDHSAAIHSVALDACLIKVTTDRPLTSCCFCQSESSLLLASDKGVIAMVSLYDAGSKNRTDVQLTTTNKDSQDVLLIGHDHEITSLDSNGDGTLIASGDSSGKYIIWEARSRQILKENKMNASISSLSFVPFWHSLASSTTGRKTLRPNFQLQSTINHSRPIPILHRTKLDTQNIWAGVIDSLLREENCAAREPCLVDPSAPSVVDTSAETPQSNSFQLLKQENERLKKINAKLYEFAVDQTFQTE